MQVLGELLNVLVRKGGKSRSDARDALLSWRDAFPVVETSPEVMLAAAHLAADLQLRIWDAVILSGASQATLPVVARLAACRTEVWDFAVGLFLQPLGLVCGVIDLRDSR